MKRKLKPAVPIDPIVVSDLEETFIENIEKFKTDSEDYNSWIAVGIKLKTSGFSFKTFKMLII